MSQQQEHTPQDFRNILVDILEDEETSKNQKVNAGFNLIDSSRLYFEGSDSDVRQEISRLMKKNVGDPHLRKIVLRELWMYQDRKIQKGIEHRWKA